MSVYPSQQRRCSRAERNLTEEIKRRPQAPKHWLSYLRHVLDNKETDLRQIPYDMGKEIIPVWALVRWIPGRAEFYNASDYGIERYPHIDAFFWAVPREKPAELSWNMVESLERLENVGKIEDGDRHIEAEENKYKNYMRGCRNLHEGAARMLVTAPNGYFKTWRPNAGNRGAESFRRIWR